MKNLKWLVLVGAVALPLLLANAQTPAAQIPADLSPSAAEVVRLAEAGTSEDVILAYIQNSSSPFSLSADQILYLKDVGLSSQATTAMLSRDSALRNQPQQETPTAPPPGPEPTTAPPPAAAAPAYVSSPPADVTYFYNDLSPYGAWVDLPGQGWCWQPTVVVVNRGWRPYCDGGHWIYTDAGWCWVSDYSWGWAPFHYGRWFLHDRCGWVWAPDRVWGPAWVTWRVAGDHCGWAPLPPHANFDVHLGWSFNGVRVGLNFDFGLHADHYNFIAMKDFNNHDLGHRRLPPAEVTRVYNQTTIINNYVVNNNRIVNQGVKVDRVSAATHTQIRAATIRDVSTGAPRPARLQGADKSTLTVYRPQLKTTAKPANMVAQKLDERHPVIQHTTVAPMKVGNGPASGRPASAPASAPSSSRTGYSAPKSYQAAPAAHSSTPTSRPADQPQAAMRSTATYQAAPATTSSKTTRRSVEETKPATRSTPGYRPDVVAPTYPLRTAAQAQPDAGRTTSQGQSTHIYYPKTYHQAADVHALPPLNPHEATTTSSSEKSSASRSSDRSSGSRSGKKD